MDIFEVADVRRDHPVFEEINHHLYPTIRIGKHPVYFVPENYSPVLSFPLKKEDRGWLTEEALKFILALPPSVIFESEHTYNALYPWFNCNERCEKKRCSSWIDKGILHYKGAFFIDEGIFMRIDRIRAQTRVFIEILDEDPPKRYLTTFIDRQCLGMHEFRSDSKEPFLRPCAFIRQDPLVHLGQVDRSSETFKDVVSNVRKLIFN